MPLCQRAVSRGVILTGCPIVHPHLWTWYLKIALKGFIQIWSKGSLWPEDELIWSFGRSKVKGQACCDLMASHSQKHLKGILAQMSTCTTHSLGHYPTIHMITIASFTEMSNRIKLCHWISKRPTSLWHHNVLQECWGYCSRGPSGGRVNMSHTFLKWNILTLRGNCDEWWFDVYVICGGYDP